MQRGTIGDDDFGLVLGRAFMRPVVDKVRSELEAKNNSRANSVRVVPGGAIFPEPQADFITSNLPG